jgi:hypothetical protein
MINNTFDDSGGNAITEALHVGALRYPGGTMSNVFNPQLGRYDMSALSGGLYAKFAPFARDIRDANPTGTYSAARFLKGAGGRANSTIWDLNVYSMNASAACAQISYIASLAQQQPGPVFLELGTELYDVGQGKPRFPNGSVYAAAMAEIVAFFGAQFSPAKCES